MSLVTRCPSCQTLFRVAPEHLEVSGGWVRCGVCDQGFDSSAQLYQALEPESSAVVAEPEPSVALDALALEATPILQQEALPASQYPDVPSAPQTSDAAPTLSTVHRFSDHLAQAEQALRSVDVSDGPGPVDPSATPSRSFRGLIGGVFSFLLGVALLAQVVVHERDRVASRLPAFQSLLEAICTAPVCAVTPLRDPGSLTIDSSSFLMPSPGNYRLSVSIKSLSSSSLVLPSIELTLTDALEQVVSRKVLNPGDFGSAGALLPPGGQWTGAVNLRVELDADTESFRGYRVLAFYP